MKLLILGGTKFLGRFLVEAALARSHQVTLFNRGKTNPHLFPGLQRLTGDRDGNLDALKSGCWDAVIDTSGFVSAQVLAAATALAGSGGHYTFISSVSVYRDFSQKDMDESASLAQLSEGVPENQADAATYGARKALCEQTLEKVLPGRVLKVRPGIIIGPHDESGRFAYWVRRIAAGGEVLAPGDPRRPIQLIDVRDLASWIIQMVERRAVGAYNVTGPRTALTFLELLDACRSTAASAASFTWVNDLFLLENQVTPFVDLPLWIPTTAKEYAGFFSVDCRKAFETGLNFRPLLDTARDTLSWDNARDQTNEPSKRVGLDAKREQELLNAWKRPGQPTTR